MVASVYGLSVPDVSPLVSDQPETFNRMVAETALLSRFGYPPDAKQQFCRPR